MSSNSNRSVSEVELSAEISGCKAKVAKAVELPRKFLCSAGCSMFYGALWCSDLFRCSLNILNGVFSSYDVWTAERCDSTFSHAPNDQGRNNLTTKVLLMFGAVSHRHTATRYLPYLKYGLWMVRCVIGAHLLKPPQTFSFTSLSSSRSLDHWAQ